jgi:dethiobiotin synthetase
MKVIVFAGTQAGVGKTTVAVGVMAALRQRGLRVQGFKVGPDLTDPLLHEAATGRPSYNLDGWMLSKEYNLGRVRRASIDADVAIVEGAEGLFDGVEGDERGSTGEIAKWLGAPVILVLDCASLRPRSAAAVLKGCLAFDDEVVVAGVVLNNTKNDAHAKIIRDAITAADLGVEVYGAVRTLESADGATNFLTTGRGGVSGASSVDRRRQLAIVANKALMAGGGTSLGQSQVVAGGNEDGGASTKERGRSGGRDAAGKGGGGEKGDNRARGPGRRPGTRGATRITEAR